MSKMEAGSGDEQMEKGKAPSMELEEETAPVGCGGSAITNTTSTTSTTRDLPPTRHFGREFVDYGKLAPRQRHAEVVAATMRQHLANVNAGIKCKSERARTRLVPR